MLGVAVISAGLGRALLERAKRTVAGRSDVGLPDPAQPLPPVGAAAELGVDGLSPVLTPNESFYRIDTAFSVPRVELPEWTLSIEGRVDRPYTIGYSDLLDMSMVERDVTLSCVSNEVGGDLVGNARWLGVPLVEILDRARPRDDAEQLVGRSVDRFTVGFPVEAVYDGRDGPLLMTGFNRRFSPAAVRLRETIAPYEQFVQQERTAWAEATGERDAVSEALGRLRGAVHKQLGQVDLGA